MAEQMTFFRSYYEAVKDMDADTRLEFLEAVIKYGLYGEMPDGLSPIPNMAFTLAFPSLKKSTSRGNASRENGMKGGRPKKPTENLKKPNDNLTETYEEPTENLKKPVDYRHKTIDNKTIDCKTIDIDIEKDLLGKGLKKKDDKSSQKEGRIPKADLDEIISRWNTLPDPVPKITVLKTGTKRYESLAARYDEYGVDNIMIAIEKVRKSSFLCGKSSSWHISFDWFVLPNNFPKVLEGNYTDSEQDQRPKSKGSLIDEWVQKGLL